ncbi:hypothetical protein [Acinetobacter sp. MD2(2019)]|uniref:hypothetical protein n=1 Tax=Acinetobacter sp. MD2(2019) TaxID=2605273 RepID=UPI002D1F340E|nr:hypothetical protein [Acinetobacter sp. MD2(2019)]MEB3753853.1 hypothetical protein [Acinetobacter sp. MD2(2019)]
MLDIYLTDTQQHVQFQDYPGDHPVKFILQFKKIFPCVMELLLPVLPSDDKLDDMTWESTTRDFDMFKLLLSGWGGVELRLSALTRYKDKAYADQFVKKANAARQNNRKKNAKLSQLELDFLFLQDLHALIDADLVEIGEKFYLPTLREQWKCYVSDAVLSGTV